LPEAAQQGWSGDPLKPGLKEVGVTTSEEVEHMRVTVGWGDWVGCTEVRGVSGMSAAEQRHARWQPKALESLTVP
jgi:hypothetical protein